jgi:gas vesicle protein
MKWTFFAGLGVGAAVGMLVAPKSGVELRDEIQEFAKENLNREKLESLAEEGRQRIQPLMDEARQRAEPMVNQVKDRVQPVIDEARERVEPAVHQARERVQSAVGSVKEQASRMSGTFLDVINEWSHDRLIAIDGIGPVLANKIIQGRPYKTEEDLTESKTLPPSAIESLRKAA